MSRDLEASVLINRDVWRFWSEVTLTETADGIAQVSLSATFDPNDRKFRDAFRPFQYQFLTLKFGEEVRFDGVTMAVEPQVSSNQGSVTLSAYAHAGILADVSAPVTSWPVEYNGLRVDAIARSLADSVGVSANTLQRDVAGDSFERVKLEPGGKILDFLATLTKQRGLIMTSAPDGSLLIKKARTNVDVHIGDLDGNAQPVTNVTPAFSVQNYFTEITGIAKAKGGAPGSKFTIFNDRSAGVFRPTAFQLNDTVPADVPTATTAKMGQMFTDAIAYTVEVATAYAPDGILWAPDTFVRLKAPGAMVYSFFTFYIRSVVFKITPASCTATLSLILPGAMAGEIPKALPWDE